MIYFRKINASDIPDLIVSQLWWTAFTSVASSSVLDNVMLTHIGVINQISSVL